MGKKLKTSYIPPNDMKGKLKQSEILDKRYQGIHAPGHDEITRAQRPPDDIPFGKLYLAAYDPNTTQKIASGKRVNQPDTNNPFKISEEEEKKDYPYQNLHTNDPDRYFRSPIHPVTPLTLRNSINPSIYYDSPILVSPPSTPITTSNSLYESIHILPPPIPIVPPPLKLEPAEPIKTIYEVLKDENCLKCTKPDPDYVSDCKHLYHLECLIQMPTNEFNCYSCREKINLSFLIKKRIEACNSCQDLRNLNTCKDCNTSYCYCCLSNTNLLKCCKNFQDPDSVRVLCPGCCTGKPFRDIVPIDCQVHSFLCKKCWSFGTGIGRCLFGCMMNVKFENRIECSVCSQNGIPYRGELVCENNCETCEICQSLYLLKNPKKCSNCKENMRKKKLPWVF